MMIPDVTLACVGCRAAKAKAPVQRNTSGFSLCTTGDCVCCMSTNLPVRCECGCLPVLRDNLTTSRVMQTPEGINVSVRITAKKGGEQ